MWLLNKNQPIKDSLYLLNIKKYIKCNELSRVGHRGSGFGGGGSRERRGRNIPHAIPGQGTERQLGAVQVHLQPRPGSDLDLNSTTPADKA